MTKNKLMSSLIIPMLCLVGGCDSDSENSDFSWPSNTADAVNQYATIVDASYEDSYTTALTLNDSLTALVMSPSATAMNDAKQAWLNSREPYLQTEVLKTFKHVSDVSMSLRP